MKSTDHINERNTNNEMYKKKNTPTSRHSQYTCIVAAFRKWYSYSCPHTLKILNMFNDLMTYPRARGGEFRP
jgi:hypothetical protein